jgi:hypothetical protein
MVITRVMAVLAVMTVGVVFLVTVTAMKAHTVRVTGMSQCEAKHQAAHSTVPVVLVVVTSTAIMSTTAHLVFVAVAVVTVCAIISPAITIRGERSGRKQQHKTEYSDSVHDCFPCSELGNTIAKPM